MSNQELEIKEKDHEMKLDDSEFEKITGGTQALTERLTQILPNPQNLAHKTPINPHSRNPATGIPKK